jgi:acetolactate decarboxylase
MYQTFALLLVPAFLGACQTSHSNNDGGASVTADDVQVMHWGGMREVLRNGKTQGRVGLSEVVGPTSFAVGALEGLAAEITVIAGEIHLAEVRQVDGQDVYNVRTANAGEQATLLVIADVPTWTEYEMPPAADLASFEASVKSIAAANGQDVTQPFPFRVEGTASAVDLHVLNHSCPIAKPDGPAPWRHTSQNQPATLIGFYAQDAAGQLTHHGQSSHIHAILPTKGISGHLDGIAFTQTTRLFLPAQ